jgi:hypothetical protein
MQSGLSKGLQFCSFYNEKTRRCTIDGTSWCAFPKSTWCDLSAGEGARDHKIPTVIVEIKRALLQGA